MVNSTVERISVFFVFLYVGYRLVIYLFFFCFFLVEDQFPYADLFKVSSYLHEKVRKTLMAGYTSASHEFLDFLASFSIRSS